MCLVVVVAYTSNFAEDFSVPLSNTISRIQILLFNYCPDK